MLTTRYHPVDQPAWQPEEGIYGRKAGFGRMRMSREAVIFRQAQAAFLRPYVQAHCFVPSLTLSLCVSLYSEYYCLCAL